MATSNKTEIILDHKFDPDTCRHYLNGTLSVLHCHHYSTLSTQLAEDCGMFDGKKLLEEVAEDAFSGVLRSYYEEHDITGLADRIAIGEQYYAACGLGQMKVLFAGPDSGDVELLHSHVDEGWIKKWGKREKPVNIITCGYIAGMFSAVFNRARRTFAVSERSGIVQGNERSKFSVVAK